MGVKSGGDLLLKSRDVCEGDAMWTQLIVCGPGITTGPKLLAETTLMVMTGSRMMAI